MIDDSVFVLRPKLVRIAKTARVDAFVKIEGTVTIGEHCHIASFSHIGVGGGEVVFGDHSGCSSHVVICSGQPDLTYAHISAADPEEHQHPIRKRTVIGKHVVIFAGAVILPGVEIGSYAVVGAGAVVTKDVRPYAIVMGVPARVAAWREGTGNPFVIRYLPKLRELAAQRDIERVRQHYREAHGDELPPSVAADLVETINALSAEMMS